MKIIGTAGEVNYNKKFLIEATEEEIASLFGMYPSELRDRKIEIKPGLVITATTEFCKLQWLRRRNKEFDDLVAKLRATADRISDSRTAFDSIIQD